MNKKITILIASWAGIVMIPYVLGLYFCKELAKFEFACEVCSITSILYGVGLWLIGALMVGITSLIGLTIFTISDEIWRSVK